MCATAAQTAKGRTLRGEALPTVSVIGLGYIGLPTAAIIARAGMQVRGVDVSQAVVDTINRGEIHIEEVDLDGLVHAVVQRGLLSAATEVAAADVHVIAVPTPGPGWRMLTRGWRLARRITSHTSSPIASATIDSSLAKAMLTSR